MSALLLDTHIWLWYAEGNAERLTAAGVRKLDQVRQAEGLRISAISIWEIGVQHAKGRVQLSAPLRDWVRDALAPVGIALLPLDADSAAESTLLPGEPHGDPADRLLIAAARTKGLILATRDKAIIDYGNAGHVRVLEL
ncbi:MAG: type II toxin-antitoxin system VapC family toxin [Gammaproteobacteria bacterium]|nr:type II toxin-antitoxin system VapC family toxin [Gammaproteobacteria bacterium]